MSSPLLALFIRSLREDSRLRMTYLARAALAVVLLFFLFGTQANFDGGGAPGLMFFMLITAIDFCFVILAGVSYFASAISEEKEEMTLGLLRMTNLNPLSILLGKSTSRLCTALLFFAAQVPFTLLAITLGGISLAQVAAGYVAVGSFLVMVSNLALLCSVICNRSASAGVLTGVALFAFLALLPLASALAQLPVALGLLTASSSWVQALNAVAAFAMLASPFFRLSTIFTTGFHEGPFSFQAWSNLGLGAAFFLVSWAVFEKFCSEQKEAAPRRAGNLRSRGGWRFLAPSRVWPRAIAWKDFYFLSGGKLWLLIKWLIYGLPIVVARFWPESLGGSMDWDNLGMAVFWLALIFIAAELMFAASSLFRVERQSQTLSGLAMLPQGIRRVAYQKLLGILPSLAPAGFYLLVGALLMARPIRDLVSEFQFDEWGSWVGLAFIAFFIAQGVFFLHLVANLSLRVKRGALPLAIGAHVILALFGVISSVGLLRDESGVIFLLFLTIAATGFLHVNTGDRLEELASEE